MKKIFLTTVFGFGLIMNGMADPSEEDMKIFEGVSYGKTWNDKSPEYYYENAHDIIQKYKQEIESISNEEEKKTKISNLQKLLNNWHRGLSGAYDYAWKALQDKNKMNFTGDGEKFAIKGVNFEKGTISNSLSLTYNGEKVAEPTKEEVKKDTDAKLTRSGSKTGLKSGTSGKFTAENNYGLTKDSQPAMIGRIYRKLRNEYKDATKAKKEILEICKTLGITKLPKYLQN